MTDTAKTDATDERLAGLIAGYAASPMMFSAKFDSEILIALRELQQRRAAESADALNFNQEFFALRNALRDWPGLPPAHVLKWLDGKFPEDWQRGKELQRELGLGVIPPKTECEIGAGIWDRITKGAWRAVAPSSPDGEKGR